MQNVVIGTAGHIDHGKTTLIKALTGHDTDTLKEEKERGITINLGFTYFDLPSKRRAGIVDVPGHEKFIKNMLAGVSGIDLFLLVIAADEGIMPQTEEHLNILRLLDIKKGIIVITKKDLVENEWLEYIKDDIKKYVKGTVFESAPIVDVSSYTGEGIPQLIELIDNMTLEMSDRDTLTEFRLPVDRVFSVTGFGTVVTGTLISGEISVGDECEIYTKGFKGRIRNIQVHEKDVEKAVAGQRVALNISGIKKEDVERGDVISKPGIMENSLIIDCRFNLLNDAPKKLQNRERIRLYHGTKEILGRIVLLDKEELLQGEGCFVQIRLEQPIAARRGDKYIIRSYSPMITIGGGTILEPAAKKHKAFDKEVIENLKMKEKGTPKEIVEKTIELHSENFLNKFELIKYVGKGIENIDQILNQLVFEKRIKCFELNNENVYVHVNYISELKNNSRKILSDYHEKNPLKIGMSKEEFKNKLLGEKAKPKIIENIFNILSKDTIDINTKYVKLKDFEIKLNKRQNEIKNILLKKLKEYGLTPQKVENILDEFGREKESARNILNILIEEEKVIKVTSEFYYLKEIIDFAKEKVLKIIQQNGQLSTAEFRDELNINRKYAVLILEYFDSIKFTQGIEDK
ncbi:MAG: selenocysteine-specific translation elongation factor [Clostridiales bacterium]|nr:selenocysteine-specific translation elongation factor [Clostridiales bacterium]